MNMDSFARFVLQDITMLLLSVDGRALMMDTGLVRAKRVAPTASGL